MYKKKLAFIDHSFHKKTLSSQFFVDILKQEFDVSHVHCDFWKNKKPINFKCQEIIKADIIVFWQILYPVHYLHKLKSKQIILIPMYDSVVGKTKFYWKQYSEFKFICFSTYLHNLLLECNIESLNIQYFIDSSKYKHLHKKIDKGSITCFFWQRTNDITWNTIKPLLPETISAFYLHLACDPGATEILPSQEDIKKYNIKISRWFEKQEDYFNLIEQCDIYFSPRMYEGIGLAFLEPMAMGKCIVAPDKPTMNEYIAHNINGFLYDPEYNMKKLSFDNLHHIRNEIVNNCKKGYTLWKKTHFTIFKYINKARTGKKKTINIIINTILYITVNTLKKIKKAIIHKFRF